MLFDRYDKQSIIRGVKNPSVFSDEIERLMWKPIYQYNNYSFDKNYSSPIYVMDHDWDLLILLDSCRYDYFKEVNNIQGELKRVVSGGSHSKEFIHHNFVKEQNHDTVYVTANPYGVKFRKDTEFFATINLLDEWDDEFETVLPSDVQAAAINAADQYPNKRLIIHFMQPHMPHIGEKSKEIRQNMNIGGWSGGIEEFEQQKTNYSIFDAVSDGKISHQELRESYKQSLKVVLGHVETIVNNVPGKKIITSDHGELLGEKLLPLFGPRKYSHHTNLKTPELRLVPWLIIDSEDRRKVIEENPTQTNEIDQNELEKKLSALGYH